MNDGAYVIWSTKKLAKEFNLKRQQVSRLLKALGAKRYTNSTWIWEG